MNIYVGNISFSLSTEDLEAAFSEYGVVEKASIIMDRDTGRSKGFGFIEMESDEDALKAIENLNGVELGGRSLRVNEAKPKEKKPFRKERSFSR